MLIGILQSRDFLEALVRGGEIDLRSMLTEPLFVHKTKTAASMLAEFKRRKAHIAIVTDDYGGTMGIVTMGGPAGGDRRRHLGRGRGGGTPVPAAPGRQL